MHIGFSLLRIVMNESRDCAHKGLYKTGVGSSAGRAGAS